MTFNLLNAKKEKGSSFLSENLSLRIKIFNFHLHLGNCSSSCASIKVSPIAQTATRLTDGNCLAVFSIASRKINGPSEP